jgi:hypothetical protein
MNDGMSLIAATGKPKSIIGDRKTFGSIPILRDLVEPFDLLLFDRDGKNAKGERSNLMDLIKERA